MKRLLTALCAGIFAMMVFVTVRASLQVSLWAIWDSYAANPWAVATLYDAYSGFTIFWLWVAYREQSWINRIVWLVLVMALGNIATSLYVLIQLARLKSGEPASAILTRRGSMSEATA